VQKSVKQKLNVAAPEAAKKSVDTLKTGKKTAENLKAKVEHAPKTTKAIKSNAKEKALDLLN
jgi:hypothetical protein